MHSGLYGLLQPVLDAYILYMEIVYIIAGIFVSAVVIALYLGHLHGTLLW